jgi:CheY-like chemotaxis protein
MSPLSFETVPVSDLIARGIIRGVDDPRPVVLVVDDEQVITDTLVAILRNNGFVAFPAYDGESALALAQEIRPQLLISDVVMPRMSGVDLAIEVSGLLPDCRVLLFSGTASSADLLESAHRLGHRFTVLTKPVHPSDLLAHISELGVQSTTQEIA